MQPAGFWGSGTAARPESEGGEGRPRRFGEAAVAESRILSSMAAVHCCGALAYRKEASAYAFCCGAAGAVTAQRCASAAFAAQSVAAIYPRLG